MAVLLCGGCKTGAIGSVDAGPFMFATTGLPNGCLIEAVRFHDEYFSNPRSRGGWLRVLQWGSKEALTVSPGHAAAVFEWQGRLAVFDVNHGVFPIPVNPAHKSDIHEVGPPIYARSPGFDPTTPEYLIDSRRRQTPGLDIPKDFPNAPKYHPLLRAAKSIARQRGVRVIRFVYTSDGEEIESAAMVFVFDGQLCIYVREKGTLVSGGAFGRLDNDARILGRLERGFGEGSMVRFLQTPRK